MAKKSHLCNLQKIKQEHAEVLCYSVRIIDPIGERKKFFDSLKARSLPVPDYMKEAEEKN